MIAGRTVTPPLDARFQPRAFIVDSAISTRSCRALADGLAETFTLMKTSGPPRRGSEEDAHRLPGEPPASPLLRAGQSLGPYRLLEWLGRGAQGEVWKARRLEPVAELVAVKVLKPSLARDSARMAQFRREAERGIRLVGPSLLTIQELSESDGYHFMTMPFVECTSLRDVIKCRYAYLSGDDTAKPHYFVTLDETEYMIAVTCTLAAAARALAAVHDQRIVHRDIKPANILADNVRRGGVYLCDFGLGRDLDFATADQMRDGAGTPLYMAPERLLRFVAIEIKCDIYSLGVTLYEALTLEKPFRVPDHVSLAGVAPFLANAEPRRPRLVDPGFPEELEALIMKAMARNPKHRHDSAHALAEDLERFAAGWSPPRQRSAIPAPHQSGVRECLVSSSGIMVDADATTGHSVRSYSSFSSMGVAVNASPNSDSLEDCRHQR
jgi:serine/threonine-protein kinase